jgi:hypothetical protein
MIRIITIAVISTFLLIPIAGYSSNIIKNEAVLIAVSFLTGYVIIPILLMRLWPSKNIKIDSIETALAKGTVLITEYEVLEMVEIDEDEDEGLHYLIAVSPEKTLSLFGQYLYPYQENEKFPSDRIRVITNTEHEYCYGIECIGNKLCNIKRIPPASAEAWGEEVVPYDLQLLNKPLSEVVSDIEKYA